MAVRTVVRNEARLLAADRVLVVSLALFAVLFAYALANGIAWVGKLEGTVEAVRAADVERAVALEAELQRIADGGEPSSPFRDPRAPNVLGGASGAAARDSRAGARGDRSGCGCRFADSSRSHPTPDVSRWANRKVTHSRSTPGPHLFRRSSVYHQTGVLQDHEPRAF